MVCWSVAIYVLLRVVFPEFTRGYLLVDSRLRGPITRVKPAICPT